MKITITGAQEVLDKLNAIRQVFDYAYEVAMPYALAILQKHATENLQNMVYDRTEGPYVGIEKGPFAEPLKGDLLDAFRPEYVEGRLGELFHETVSGLFLELGTDDHAVSPNNAPEMVWRNAWSGDIVRSAGTHIVAGIKPLNWFELAMEESKPEIYQLFRDTYAAAIARKLR